MSRDMFETLKATPSERLFSNMFETLEAAVLEHVLELSSRHLGHRDFQRECRATCLGKGEHKGEKDFRRECRATCRAPSLGKGEHKRGKPKPK